MVWLHAIRGLPDLEIRRATPADLDALMVILDAAAARHQRRPWQRGHVEQGIVDDDTPLGFEAGRLVASATLQRSDPDVWGTESEVAPAAAYVHRVARLAARRGWGAAIMAGAERWAAAAEVEALRLDCSADNERLRRYYGDLGYTEVKVVELAAWRTSLFEKRL